MGWVALLAVFVIAALASIVRPILGPRLPWTTPRADSDLDELLAEKARTLRTLKDLDAERLAGLVGADEHAATRGSYVERAVELNRRIAHLTGVDPSRMEDPVSEAGS